MAKSLYEMAADIVQAQAATKNMTTEEIAALLQSTFKTLSGLQSEEQRAGSTSTEAIHEPDVAERLGISSDKAIQKNKIICMECGQEFRMLSPKHLRSHNLNGKEYRKKYGYSARQPLCAKTLSDRRKKAGKERGLPDNLRKAIEDRKNKKAEKEKKKRTSSATKSSSSSTK